MMWPALLCLFGWVCSGERRGERGEDFHLEYTSSLFPVCDPENDTVTAPTDLGSTWPVSSCFLLLFDNLLLFYRLVRRFRTDQHCKQCQMHNFFFFFLFRLEQKDNVEDFLLEFWGNLLKSLVQLVLINNHIYLDLRPFRLHNKDARNCMVYKQ